MTSSDYELTDSRIADDSQNWQGACGDNITNWSKSDVFVISITATCGAHLGCAQRTMTLYWRDNDDASPTWTALTTGEFAQATADDPGAAGCASVDQTIFITNGNQGTFDARSQNEIIELAVAVSPAGAQDGHEYQFILYDETDEAFIDESTSVTLTIATGAVPSSHTFFKTPQYSGTAHHVRLGWTMNSGCFGYSSGMRATGNTPTHWDWGVITSSHEYFYPSGLNSTSFVWTSGSCAGGGIDP